MSKEQRNSHAVWGYVARSGSAIRKSDALDDIVPHDLKNTCVTAAGSGELLLPYAEALQIVAMATSHGIAVLGVESFEIRGDGAILALDYSGYEFPRSADWPQFVNANNREADRWIRNHRLGEERAYILTAVSEAEFQSLKESSG